MIETLQEALFYIEEQNDWLSHLQSIIASQDAKYKALHLKISNKIVTELSKCTKTTNETIKADKMSNSESKSTEVSMVVGITKTAKSLQKVEDAESKLSTNQSKVLTQENQKLKPSMRKSHSRKQKSDGITRNAKSDSKKVIKKNPFYHAGKLAQYQYKCPYCPNVFNHRSPLIAHLNSHASQNKSCKICGKQFTIRYSLKTHMLIHTGEKPYKCTHCNKQFTQKGTLTNHLRLHTGEKPFKCAICSKSFTQRSQLNVHMQTHEA